MEALAYRILQIGEIGSLALAWAVLFVSAAATLAFTKYELKLSRPAYFLITGLSFLLCAMTSLFALGIQDAIKNDYLAAIVALSYGSLIPIGALAGISAAARSNDAYGTRDKWFLSFVPFANLALLFGASLERPESGFPRVVRSIVLVTLGVLMMGAAGGVSRWVERQAAQAADGAQNDAQLQDKVIRYEVQNNGLEASLKEAAEAIPVPAKLDAITSLKAVEVDKETFRYVYEISDKNANFSSSWQDIMTNRWCKSPDFKAMIDLGATVEGKYVSQDGQQLASLRVSTALCEQWRSQFQKAMDNAANAIKGPTKLDEVTTLMGADYKDGTFSYYYTFALLPRDPAWKEYMKNRWCQTDQFKAMMAVDLDIRGVYTTETNAPIGEVLVNSRICSTSALN